MLCQKDIPEELRCPADVKRSIKGIGYKTLADNLFGFRKIDSLPNTIDLARLDDGDGVEATFQRNRAKWHDSCRLEFNSTQLVRAEKRKTPCKDIPDVLKKFTRQSVDKKSQPKDTCFFCDEHMMILYTKHRPLNLTHMSENVHYNWGTSLCWPN